MKHFARRMIEKDRKEMIITEVVGRKGMKGKERGDNRLLCFFHFFIPPSLTLKFELDFETNSFIQRRCSVHFNLSRIPKFYSIS